MTTCSLAGLALGQSTLIVRSLDENYQKTVTITVKACASTPDIPTGITFSKTGIKLNEEITATATPEVTSGGAVPAQYNWTIPSEYFEITGDNDKRVISLKAIAASPGITDAIKVNAQNTCGTSTTYSNTTALSIFDCTDKPATPDSISFTSSTVAFDSTFTASVPAVTTGTQIPTSYTWTIPTGLTPIDSITTTTTPSITLTGTQHGTYFAGTIKVKAANDCGTSDEQASDLDVIVSPPACSGIFIPEGAYTGPDTMVINDFSSMATVFAAYTWTLTGDLCLAGSDTADTGWETAKSLCAAMDADGFSTWRLPNFVEFHKMYDKKAEYGLQQNFYWSSHASTNSTSYAWRPENNSVWISAKSISWGVRCVRSL
jgi:hypothetical protein